MDQGQTRMMGVLAAVLGTVTAALWWWDTPETDPDPDATVPVWKVDATAITRIEVERATGSLVLAAGDDGGWAVVEPEPFDADPERVRALANALGSIEKGVPIAGADPAEFGLGEPPVAKVTVTQREGAPQTLVFGNEAPVGWSTYARAGTGEIVAVPGKPVSDLTAGADHYRDRRILRFAPETVRAITLAGPDGTLTVRGDERPEPIEGAPPLVWWLEGWTRADPDRVDDLVTGLLTLRFDEIQPATTVATPKITATVRTTERTWTLKIGESDGSFSPVEVDGGLAGVALSDSLAILGMGPTDLGDSRAFPYDPDTADRIEVVVGERHWVALRNGPAWEIDGKESADAAEVARVVDQAAISYGRDPIPPPERIALSVIVGDGPGKRQVDVGPPSGELATARDAAGGSAYHVPEQDLEPLRRLFAQ
jgi:hypothetical protein